VSYEILMPEKIRSLSISEAYEYIEAIQSFPGRWPSIIITLPAEGRRGDVEGITPLPTTHGALCFPELYLSEDALFSVLSEHMRKADVKGVLRALDRGLPLHKVIPPRLLEEVDRRIRDVIAGLIFEVFIPLRKMPEGLNGLEGLGIADSIETFRSVVFPVEPTAVRRALDESYYVGEYLEKLEALFDEVEEMELDILIARGYMKAQNTLLDLEARIEALVERIPALRKALMFTRAICSSP